MATASERTTQPLQTDDPLPGLDDIYRTAGPGIRGRLIALTRDQDLADDLLSEAFLRLAIELKAGRRPSDPAAWLYRVATNLAISTARRGTVAARALPTLLDGEGCPSPEEAVIRREDSATLRNAMAALCPADRQVVVLAAAGFDNDEMARIVGRSKGATRTLLCRARSRLRKELMVERPTLSFG